ncbi:MAG: hypothetical protein CMJ06_01515 [Pelagibacterales bacterium]|nr:hypothetical protein [Pelagibacterales bacterium]OUU63339.1 MAG: hypothetical protein CBC22_01485 [Alphaproteobacteria bacterium TMED62]|tara:strand:- start:3613 stop:4503 length:891 start_codon:yes stop_codon:yes gene_type:complete
MFNKKLKLGNAKLDSDTILFFLSTILFITFFEFFGKNISNNALSIILITFIVFFGLPHGALDTLIAKKFNLYKNFYQFLIFNFVYISLALIIFMIWQIIPTFSLAIFLIISGYHFSEDWDSYNIDKIKKLALGFSIINLPVLFNMDLVEEIYYYITSSDYVYSFLSFQLAISYLNLLLLLYILLSKTMSINIFLQIVLLILSAFILDPIPFFICYFCFFHSLKNFKESKILLLNINKRKITFAAFINTLLSIILGVIIFFLIYSDFNLKNITSLIFIGLAALTVPHMLLRILIRGK